MSRDEIETVAEEAADKAIHRLFLTVGIDVTDPKAVIAFQDDLRHVRRWREATQTAQQHALRTAIGVLVTGAMGWLAIIFYRG